MALCFYFLAGLAWWSLLEYLLHRFVFHRFPRTLGRRHLQHHAQPRVRRLARAPLASSLGGLALHGLAAIPFLGLGGAGAFVAGVALGYLGYEWMHWQIHYGRRAARRWPVLYRHHLLHHHAHPGTRFGVSTRVWDRIFRSMRPAGRPPTVS